MTCKELFKDFKKFNDGELFYKHAFDTYRKKHPGCKYITAEQLFEIVEAMPSLKENLPDGVFVLPDEFQDESFFTVENGSNINILRHNRYTPMFFNKCSFYDVVIILKGSCTHVMNDTSFTLREGDICFVPPKMPHTTITFNDSIVFDMLIRRRFFSDVLFNFFSQKNPLYNFFTTSMYCKRNDQYLIFHTDGDKEITNLLLEMYIESHHDRAFSKQILENQAVILFSKLLRQYSDKMEQNTIPKYRNDKSVDLILYIEQNIDNVTLDNMSKHFGYAPQYLSKKIKKDLGTGFNEIVKQLKLKKAEQLLLKTTKSVSEISEELGYLNAENFIRFFKTAHASTPTEYRKNNTT